MVDPRRARAPDRTWWLAVRWASEYLETRDAVALLELEHLQHCAAVDYGQKTAEHHWQHTDKIQAAVMKLRMPWTAYDASLATRRFVDDWVDAWGRPGDPATDAKIANTLRLLRAMQANRTEHAGA
jgi:hypothetical protein